MAKDRLLLYAPVMHNVGTEMGKVYARKIAAAGLSANEMESYSDSLFRKIEGKLGKYEVNKVYADSIWEGGENALDAVKELGKDGSYMCRIILDLVEKGARIMKAESGTLLEKSLDNSYKTTAIYGKAMKLLERMKAGNVTKEQADIGAKDTVELLKYIVKLDESCNEERDRYIGRRISMTLRKGETAALFLGAHHSPEFDPSIDVRYLLDPKEVLAAHKEKFQNRAVQNIMGRFLDASKNVKE